MPASDFIKLEDQLNFKIETVPKIIRLIQVQQA